jgi:putative inorganic carbon (hco3(-)) transporter
MDYAPVLVILGCIFSIPIFIFFFEKPVYLLYTLVLSILAGSIGEVKLGGKIPQILYVDLFFPLFFIIFIFRTLFKSESEKKYHLIAIFLSIFLVWGCLSFFIAVDKLRFLLIWKSYFYGLIFFLFTYWFVKTPKEIKTTLIIFILFGIILAFIEFSIVIDLGGLQQGLIGLFIKKNLLATSWGKSNYLATFYVLIIPLTIGYFLVVKSIRYKLLIATSILIMFSALILTLSRGGIVALGIALVFLLSRILRPKTFLPIFFTMILVGTILFLNPLTSVLIERLATVETSFSYMTRVNFYKDVWQMFLDNPVVGVGIGNLGYHSTFVIVAHSSAHNIILGLLGETGIPGALLFISLMFYIVFYFTRSFSNEKNHSTKILLWSFLSSLVGVYIHAMMEPNFEGFQFSILFWTALALFIKYTELDQSAKDLIL